MFAHHATIARVPTRHGESRGVPSYKASAVSDELFQTLTFFDPRDLLLKILHVAPAEATAMDALRGLEFDRCFREVLDYWRQDNRRGSQIETPVAHLDAVHVFGPVPAPKRQRRIPR